MNGSPDIDACAPLIYVRALILDKFKSISQVMSQKISYLTSLQWTTRTDQ